MAEFEVLVQGFTITIERLNQNRHEALADREQHEVVKAEMRVLVTTFEREAVPQGKNEAERRVLVEEAKAGSQHHKGLVVEDKRLRGNLEELEAEAEYLRDKRSLVKRQLDWEVAVLRDATASRIMVPPQYQVPSEQQGMTVSNIEMEKGAEENDIPF